MGKVLSEITAREEAFIAKQKVFFVATAPLSAEHCISVSPKAPGTSCVVLSPHAVAYADLTGSGSETAAHVLQNGRMTLLFCNLEHGAPKILRLHGKAEVILADSASNDWREKFPESITTHIGFRAIYKLNVKRISTSCGFSLPVLEFQKYRTTLDEITEKEGPDGIFDYCTKKNSFSIDGLPSLALLRKKAPNVKIVKEEGYYFGNVIHGESGPSPSAHIDYAAQIQPFKKDPATGTMVLRRMDALFLGLSILVLGVAIGVMLER